MIQRKIIFLINPISGTQNKGNLMGLIEFFAKKYKVKQEMLYTSPNGDYTMLYHKIQSDNITDVIICGGDGTVNQIVSALYKCNITFGIIPHGSGNGMAFAAGIPKKVSQALSIVFEGKAKYVDAFTVNGRFGCMLTGLGFDAVVAHQFLHKKKRGLFTYIKISLHNYFYSKFYPFEIEINNQKILTEAFFISVANSNQFGNFVTIAPQASLHDGLLDIVIVNKTNKVLTALSILKQIAAGKVIKNIDDISKKKPIYYLHSNKILIQNPSLAPLHIDGEPIETAKTVEIKIMPNAFRLIMKV